MPTYQRKRPLRDKGYVIDKAMQLWLDSESFSWREYPDSKEDLECTSHEGEKMMVLLIMKLNT